MKFYKNWLRCTAERYGYSRQVSRADSSGMMGLGASLRMSGQTSARSCPPKAFYTTHRPGIYHALLQDGEILEVKAATNKVVKTR